LPRNRGFHPLELTQRLQLPAVMQLDGAPAWAVAPKRASTTAFQKICAYSWPCILCCFRRLFPGFRKSIRARAIFYPDRKPEPTSAVSGVSSNGRFGLSVWARRSTAAPPATASQVTARSFSPFFPRGEAFPPAAAAANPSGPRWRIGGDGRRGQSGRQHIVEAITNSPGNAQPGWVSPRITPMAVNRQRRSPP